MFNLKAFVSSCHDFRIEARIKKWARVGPVSRCIGGILKKQAFC